METGSWLRVSSDRLKAPGIELETLGTRQVTDLLYHGGTNVDVPSFTIVQSNSRWIFPVLKYI